MFRDGGSQNVTTDEGTEYYQYNGIGEEYPRGTWFYGHYPTVHVVEDALLIHSLNQADVRYTAKRANNVPM